MLRRAAAILIVFLSSVGFTVALFYASAPVTIAAALLVPLAVVGSYRLTRPRRPGSACRCCGYDLTGLEPVGLCPECAEPYTERLDLEDILRERLEARNRPPDPARDGSG